MHWKVRKVLPGHAQGLSQRPHGSDSGGEQEREKGKRCLITHFVHCKFLYHIFLSSSFFLLSLSLFCGFGSVPTNTYTRRHTHRCCMELLCKTIKNGNLNAAPKSRLWKNTATVLIAVSLALFFPLSFPPAVMCVIQFKLFPKRWHLERDSGREWGREEVRLVY